jgi:ornithine cyclodeaminase/alanine dehydrogenase-like protein (mu-crystallin family)
MAALIEADALGQLRTGAASGVATKYLANENARTACIIGTGYQARTQLEAVAAVRRLERVRAFGRDPERREKFCREMSERISVAVEPMNSGEEAVKGAEIIITATSATKVVLEGAWLAPGMHINAMGANWPQKRELDAAAVGRAHKIVVDSVEQSKMEAGIRGGPVAMGRGAGTVANRRRQSARQKRRRSNHFVQIEWDCNMGPGRRRARI